MSDASDGATTEIETRAASLLRGDPGLAVPLLRLHERLIGQLGRVAVGTPAELRQRLAQRPDLFLILDPPEPVWNAQTWDAGTRRAYRHAFRTLDIESGPYVALAQPPEIVAPVTGPEDAIRRLEASLLGLWTAARGDPGVQVALFEAVTEAREVRTALGFGT